MQDSTIKGSDDQHPTMHRAAPPQERTLVMSFRGSQAEHAISRKWHVSDVLQAVDVAWLKVTGRGNTLVPGLSFPLSASCLSFSAQLCSTTQLHHCDVHSSGGNTETDDWDRTHKPRQIFHCLNLSPTGIQDNNGKAHADRANMKQLSPKKLISPQKN